MINKSKRKQIKHIKQIKHKRDQKSKKRDKKSKKRDKKSKKRDKKSKKRNQKKYLGVCQAVTSSNGTFDWPEDNGCVSGTKKMLILPKGKIVDRFGSHYGKFLGEDSESYDDRAIPYFSNTDECENEYKNTYNNNNPKNNYHTYQVINEKGLPVESCQIKPHFGHGILRPENVQYFVGDNESILSLLEKGQICEIQHENRPAIEHDYVCANTNKKTTFYPPFRSEPQSNQIR